MDTQLNLENMSSFEYNLFLLETSIEEYKLESIINESIILASTNKVKDIKIVHENFKEKMKNAFDKLIETIKRLWAKFVETMTGLFTSDQKYLEKYKDIITKANFNGLEYMMYPYHTGLKYIEESKVPAFNYSSLRESLVSEEQFRDKYFKTFVKDGVDFNDRIRQLMRGSDKEQKISATVLDPNMLYNYCHDFPKLLEKIKKDMHEVEKAGNDAISKISSMKTTTANESAVYSFIHESVLVSEIKKIEDDNPQQDDNDRGKLSKTVQNVDGKHDTSNVEDNVKNISDDLDRIKLYIRVCYSFLGVKMSIAQEAYKAFMFIIRDYVKSKVGTKKEKDNTEQNKGTEKETKSDSGKEAKAGWVDKVATASKKLLSKDKKNDKKDDKKPDTN